MSIYANRSSFNAKGVSVVYNRHSKYKNTSSYVDHYNQSG